MTDAGGWHGIWSARGLAARLLWPLSLLYGAVLALRLWLYRTGWLRRVKLPVPVLVVGNVIVGGAGKTPVTIELALQLRSKGWRIGI